MVAVVADFVVVIFVVKFLSVVGIVNIGILLVWTVVMMDGNVCGRMLLAFTALLVVSGDWSTTVT